MITNAPELEATCSRLRQEGVCAIDTEFVWRSTYRPRLGVVQIGSKDGTGWVIDCLQGFSPSSFGALVSDDSTVKILHDARQDLEHVYHWTGALPKNVFDTQLAAGFAGLSCRISLQKLLLEAVNVGLAKSETQTDWCQRPLTDKQLEYALDDVRYLEATRQELLRRAAEFDTLDWLKEEMAKYDDPSLYLDTDPHEAWKRVKGASSLGRRQLAVLREVAAVREETARKMNLSRGWIADDESLLSIASRADEKNVQFRHRLRDNGMKAQVGGAFAAAIVAAKALPDDQCPELVRSPKCIPEVKKAADAALEYIRVMGEQLHVDPALIGSRATVTAWVDDPDDETNPLAQGWRYEIAGREIAEQFAVA